MKRSAVLSSLKTADDRLLALHKIANATLANRIDPEVARTLIYTICSAQLL